MIKIVNMTEEHIKDLAELEKDFAVKSGLIDEQQTDDCTLSE